MNVKRCLAFLVLAASAAWAWAVPSVAEVQAEVGRGNYAHAETMMQEVVNAKPGSARAHYVYAEILAHNKRFDEAAKQAASAKALDPALKFADATRFKAFEQLLEREQRAVATPRVDSGLSSLPATSVAPAAAPAPERSGMPGWVVVVGLAALAGVGLTMLTRRSSAQAAAGPDWRQAGAVQPNAPMGSQGYGQASGQPYGGPGSPGSYGPGGVAQPGMRGSGMMGMGLAAAGGLAAGMLAEKMLDGRHADSGNAGSLSDLSRGLSPHEFSGGGALADDPAARELQERPVDFGEGGGDWGVADGGSDGGSFGGDSGGGDGGW